MDSWYSLNETNNFTMYLYSVSAITPRNTNASNVVSNQGTTTGMYQCLDWLQAHVPKPIERLILQFSQSSDTLRQNICNCPLELNNQNHSKHSKHKTRYCVCSCEHCCHNERCQQDNINGRNQLYLGNSQYERPIGWNSSN